MTNSGESLPGAAAILQRRGPIAVITLNRPTALNAVNSALSTAVGNALEELANDPEMRVGILTGAGRAFCAGADLKELAAGRTTHAHGHPEWGFAGVVRHFVSKPLIAAVNGYALGGGTEIVLACDLAVIDPDASLGLPEVTRGLFAAAGGVLRLQRELPPKVAAEVALAGRGITAVEAARWGLVNAVSAPGQVLFEAMALAERVAAGAPLAVQASKRLLQLSPGVGGSWDDEVWEMNAREREQLFGTDDAKEGPRAFAAKRSPVWTGR